MNVEKKKKKILSALSVHESPVCLFSGINCTTKRTDGIKKVGFDSASQTSTPFKLILNQETVAKIKASLANLLKYDTESDQSIHFL